MNKASKDSEVGRSQELLDNRYSEFFLQLNMYMEKYKKNREEGERICSGMEPEPQFKAAQEETDK